MARNQDIEIEGTHYPKGFLVIANKRFPLFYPFSVRVAFQGKLSPYPV